MDQGVVIDDGEHGGEDGEGDDYSWKVELFDEEVGFERCGEENGVGD